MKPVASLKRGSIVTLNEAQFTVRANFKVGDTLKFLSIFNGSLLRCSRIGDNAKIICRPEVVGYTFEDSRAPQCIPVARPDYTIFSSPHSDESGSSRQIVTSVCLAGKFSGTTTIHLTPSEELGYNEGMAKLAEMG